MGNSEVGHNALGSGQVIDQGARLVDIALESGSAFELDGFKYIQQAFADHTVHFIGLLSDGGERLDLLSLGFLSKCVAF
jgi:2,3-bisphosphoglycerate-independent phosphoglycerate mutase